ncbi:helix-turn-helix domain-containing protein [Streptomyces sp. NPDC101490]|uniref:helix-turn-helix domain-containing protein n=1 Tax=Streptomyces sp. NPDC101490 TaxID=3366143 RepID=UPI003815B2CC
MEVSCRLRIAPDTVRTWPRRFIEHGLDGLGDEPRPGAPRIPGPQRTHRPHLQRNTATIRPALRIPERPT